jgi:hypothetical protein
MARLSIFLALLAIASPGLAGDFYIDPEHGDAAGDGSADKPWRNLQETIDRGLVQSRGWAALPYNPQRKLVPKNEGAPIKPGDTIWLRSGNHGDVTIRKHFNAGVITIAAQPGHTPRFRSLLLQSSSHWVLKGLHVSPEFGTGPKPRTMIDIQSHGWNGPIHDVLVEQCVLQSTSAPTSSPRSERWEVARRCRN